MYLLDTHALLWWLADSPRLGNPARGVIEEGANAIHVSSISAVEIAVKSSLGKLKAPTDLEEQLEANEFSSMPLTVAHTMHLADLPMHHRDPFDRILIAQAQLEELTIITADPVFDTYDVATLEASRA